MSSSKLAPDWLHKNEQSIGRQVSKLTQPLTMTQTHKFPLQLAALRVVGPVQHRHGTALLFLPDGNPGLGHAFGHRLRNAATRRRRNPGGSVQHHRRCCAGGGSRLPDRFGGGGLDEFGGSEYKLGRENITNRKSMERRAAHWWLKKARHLSRNNLAARQNIK